MFNLKQFFRSFFHTDTANNAEKLIITARCLEITPHPNADRLVLVKVGTGKSEVYPVVCGAKNFKVGDVVVLALPGAHIAQNIHSKEHESFVLEKATIRGVESQGMLCAPFELGLTKVVGDGIAVLPPETPLGVDASSYLS